MVKHSVNGCGNEGGSVSCHVTWQWRRPPGDPPLPQEVAVSLEELHQRALRGDGPRALGARQERRRRDGPEGLRAGARGEHGGVLVLPLQAAALRGLLGLGGHP